MEVKTIPAGCRWEAGYTHSRSAVCCRARTKTAIHTYIYEQSQNIIGLICVSLGCWWRPKHPSRGWVLTSAPLCLQSKINKMKLNPPSVILYHLCTKGCCEAGASPSWFWTRDDIHSGMPPKCKQPFTNIYRQSKVATWPNTCLWAVEKKLEQYAIVSLHSVFRCLEV